MSKSAAIPSANFTGTLDPDTHGFTVTDPSNFLTIVIDGLSDTENVQLVRENFSADGWQPYTDGGKKVILNSNLNSATPLKPGNYGLSGDVSGVTVYTEEM